MENFNDVMKCDTIFCDAIIIPDGHVMIVGAWECNGVMKPLIVILDHKTLQLRGMFQSYAHKGGTLISVEYDEASNTYIANGMQPEGNKEFDMKYELRPYDSELSINYSIELLTS